MALQAHYISIIVVKEGVNCIKEALLRLIKLLIALQKPYTSNIIDNEDVNCITKALD